MIQKKRGRPKKVNVEQEISYKKENFIEYNDNMEIILHLPIKLNSNINTNLNSTTISDDSEHDNSNQKSLIENENQVSEFIADISDTHDEIIIENNENIKKLLNEMKEKDNVINSLKNYISNLTNKKYNKSDIIYHNISNNIYSIDDLSNKKNIKCWWCCHDFDNHMCFIPDKFDDNIFYVFGCFCSYNCAASYNLNMGDYRVNERYTLLKKMYNIAIGDNKEIDLAPQKEILTAFGGILSIEEFRNKNKNYKLLLPPLVPVSLYIEEKSV